MTITLASRILVPLVGIVALVAAAPSNAASLTRGPYLQMPTPTSIHVRWRTDTPENSRVEYGASAGTLDSTQDDRATLEFDGRRERVLGLDVEMDRIHYRGHALRLTVDEAHEVEFMHELRHHRAAAGHLPAAPILRILHESAARGPIEGSAHDRSRCHTLRWSRCGPFFALRRRGPPPGRSTCRRCWFR